MATAAQQAAFKATYGPQAVKAGQALGDDPNLIYAQWANESGYGTNTQAANFNVAGIQPGGRPATYTSPDDFETHYVSLMQSNFPAATNVGSSPAAFVSGLQNGTKGSYFGTDSASTYQANIASISGQNPLGTIQNNDPNAYITGGATSTPDTSGTLGGSLSQGGITGGAAGTGGAASGTLNWIWEIVSRGLLIIVGFGLVMIALIALLFQSKTVKTSVQSLGAFAA